jgi:hypothetical protein
MEYSDINKKDELINKNLIALMDNLSYTTISGKKKDPIDEIINYRNIKEEVGSGDKAGDPISLIKLTFLLFEDIQNDKIIELKKWFRVCILYIDETNTRYKINFKNIIDIIPKKKCDDKTELCNLQLMINTDYINPSKYNMLLFQETKFLLFTINDIALIGKDHSKFNLSIEANKTINIYNRNYKLRGCIIHTGDNRASGHDTFLAYNNEGEKAALLNGSYKTNLLDINDDHSVKRDFNPNTKGTLYLYELADEDTDLAASLAGSLAVATETKPASETDIATALTATLAAAVPDTSSTTNIPAALIGTVAAAAAPTQSAKPPDQSAKPPANPPTAKPPTAKPPTAKPPTAKPPGGDLDDNVDRQRSLASGAREREGDRAKPPVKEQVEEKPYSGSLEPSSDSNGENMVLGILLVITLAISGVLFVQH